jgi:hypothetical protein
MFLLASLAKRGDVFRFWAKPENETLFLYLHERSECKHNLN